VDYVRRPLGSRCRADAVETLAAATVADRPEGNVFVGEYGRFRENEKQRNADHAREYDLMLFFFLTVTATASITIIYDRCSISFRNTCCLARHCRG